MNVFMYGGPLDGQELAIQENIKSILIPELSPWPSINTTGKIKDNIQYGYKLEPIEVQYIVHEYRMNNIFTLYGDKSISFHIMTSTEEDLQEFIQYFDLILALCGVFLGNVV